MKSILKQSSIDKIQRLNSSAETKYKLFQGAEVIFQTNDEPEMVSFMKSQISKDHEAFVDMVFMVENKVTPKTIFLLGK